MSLARPGKWREARGLEGLEGLREAGEVVCSPLAPSGRPGSSAGLGGEFWAELGHRGQRGPEGKASSLLGRQEGHGDSLSP